VSGKTVTVTIPCYDANSRYKQEEAWPAGCCNMQSSRLLKVYLNISTCNLQSMLYQKLWCFLAEKVSATPNFWHSCK